MGAVTQVAPWDVIPMDNESLTAGFVVLDPVRPHNQLEQVFIVCWPWQQDDNGKYPAVSFSSRSDREQLRKLRDAVTALLDTQADLAQAALPEMEKEADATVH